MKLEIPLEIIQQTTNCKKQFACLTHPETLCKLHQPPAPVLFLEAPARKYCHYKLSFGNEFYCNCPTRRAIYEKYKL